MASGPPSAPGRRVLLIGASRGLGLALAREWARGGRRVVAAVRGSGRTPLHDLADTCAEQIEIETVDVTEPAQIAALHDRLADRMFDLLFVNAGVTNQPEGTVAQTPTGEFIRVMVTNALGPLRVIEALQDRVEPAGTIGVMSSGQGSVANNERGGHEVYRGSKAALNTFMRSYAARHSGERRTLVLMAPGWVRTELGGLNARLSIDESIPNVVRTLDALQGETRSALRRLPRPDGSVVNAAPQQAWALMQRFVEAHNRRGELAEALGFRLGGGRGKILFQLRDGPVTLSQLAEVNGVDAPYATLIVDKLEAHGLVERRPHPDDRRRKLVTLTAAGHNAIATADAILLRPPAAVTNLPADDLEQLTGLLTRLLDADAAEPADPKSSAPASMSG